jgi:hypothetical protein
MNTESSQDLLDDLEARFTSSDAGISSVRKVRAGTPRLEFKRTQGNVERYVQLWLISDPIYEGWLSLRWGEHDGMGRDFDARTFGPPDYATKFVEAWLVSFASKSELPPKPRDEVAAREAAREGNG